MGATPKFVNYPEAQSGPDVPYKSERKNNPPVRGASLMLGAYFMESSEWLRSYIWRNAGFGNLRDIRFQIEDCEPRYDPTVVPIVTAEPNEKGPKPNGVKKESSFSSKRGARFSGYYSVADYHRLYLSGEISPVAVARAILPLIRRDVENPTQYATAWFETKVELVMKAAKASAKRYKEGKPLGPMDGVPTAVKDEYEMDGYKTCLGSRNDYTAHSADGASMTSWCVKKLEEAGAIVLGKLSMHEFGLDTTGNNPIYGTPRNPYNDEYYTGGSSSGSGYAVSAGLVPFALGSDGGGSIRIPSSFCCVFGLKPSHGRVSFRPGPNHSITCAVNGPIAADIASLAALFEVISVPHPTSGFPHPTAFSVPDTTQRNKVLGIPEDWFADADPAVQTLCRSMINRLVKEHGYETVSIKIPFAPEGQIAHAMTVLTDGATLLPETKNLTYANRLLLALGRTTPSTDYLLAQKLRGLLMKHLAYLWKTHPGMIIVTPTTACAGWKIQTQSELNHGLSDGDKTIRSMLYVWLANFCGLPALTVPAGYVAPEGHPEAGSVADEKVEGKVPVGLMGTGEWTQEHNLLQFGVDAEAAGADVRTRPPIWVDVVAKAREEMKNGEAAELWGA